MEIDIGPQAEAATKAVKAVVEDKAFHKFRYDGEQIPLIELNAAINRMFGRGIDNLESVGPKETHFAFDRAMVAELASWGVMFSDVQQRLFVEAIGKHAAWHKVFRVQFGEQLVADEAARTILVTERLGELRANGIELIAEVKALYADVRAGFAASATADEQTHARLRRLLANQGDGAQASLDMLSSLADQYAENVDGTDIEGLRAYLIQKINHGAITARGSKSSKPKVTVTPLYWPMRASRPIGAISPPLTSC